MRTHSRLATISVRIGTHDPSVTPKTMRTDADVSPIGRHFEGRQKSNR